MRYGNYLPQHSGIRYRIHWKQVINFYEQSAPWPDPKARDKNWSPEKTSTELSSRDKRETLDNWSFLLAEPPFNFSIPILLCHTETKQLKGQILPHAVTALGEGKGTPLQYSCLENPMDRGAAVHGVAKSRTRLSDFTFTHWRRKWQATPVFLPGESQGWGSLVGCRLWGRTESDTTEAA